MLLDFIIPRHGQGWTGLMLAFPVMVAIVFLVIRFRTYEPMPWRMVAPAWLVLSGGWALALSLYSEIGLIVAFVLFAGYTGFLFYWQNENQ